MAPVPPPSRPSLKDIARRVSVAPQAPRAAIPSVPPLHGLGGDTVRPVALSTPPVPPDHPALAELAQICERSVQEGARRHDGARLAPVAPSLPPRPVARQRSKWATLAPIAGGVLVAIAAIATSAVVLTRSHADIASASAVPAVVATSAQVAAAPEQPNSAAETIAQPTPVATPALAELNPEPPAAAAARTPAESGKPGGAIVQSSAATPAAVVPPTGAAPASAPPAEPAAPAAEQRPEDLSNAMAAAVSGGQPPPTAARPFVADTPPDGSIPESPSQGAIQAALSGVRESARSCVVGMDEASRATVVFGSSGSVARVVVSGPAAGRGAESCIRAALSNAKVAPFRKASFSVGITLRP